VSSNFDVHYIAKSFILRIFVYLSKSDEHNVADTTFLLQLHFFHFLSTLVKK